MTIKDKCFSAALSLADRLGMDALYLSLMFYSRLSYWPNLRHPVTFNEKIQWMKLHDRDPRYTQYADKYAVRKHIQETIGAPYLIPLLGVYDSAAQIDFGALPQQFVLKCNHGAGYNIVCTDKNALDQEKARAQLDAWMHEDFYRLKREYHYRDIPRKILCEQFMEDGTSRSLNDYKFFCIGGRVEMIQVDYDRYTEHRRNIFDRNGERMDVEISFPTKPGIDRLRFPELEKMIEIAETLSAGFRLVRIDLYLINGRIYFGEMTFTPGAGFSRYKPRSFEVELGEKLAIQRSAE